MTNEEKELLLQDLYCRLPYGVMIHVEHDWREDEVPPYDALLTVECHSILNNFCENPLTCCLIIKPYLRSMEDMTEKEKIIYQSKQTIIFDFKNNKLYVDNYYSLDWLNEHHFDYRGLIEKGLALEAPKDMYK